MLLTFNLPLLMFCALVKICINTTPGRQQSKMLIPSTNVDHKSLETESSIAICRLTGDKWQSKTLFLAIFDLHWLIVKSGFFSCRLSGVNASKSN